MENKKVKVGVVIENGVLIGFTSNVDVEFYCVEKQDSTVEASILNVTGDEDVMQKFAETTLDATSDDDNTKKGRA
ncbi:hypothetical protein [Kurthia sp. Dielmo]|uniref:hypothetical protein n=1 Tax=Kurthia sp. Dielmo TaxID=1033738 RepID=UPI00111F5DB6|nr:hypothetical protein [Kurthia sp. Dielmo]